MIRTLSLEEERGEEGCCAPKAPTLEEVYPHFVQTVARWVARLGGPDMDVEDTVQEVFLIVHRKLPSFRGESRLSTWLYSITQKVVAQRRRKQRLRRWLRRDFGAVAGLASELPSPCDQLERLEATRRVYSLLDTLPERYRTALILREYEGLPTDEVAELLRIKPATVAVWLHRARALLAKQLQVVEKEKGSAC